MTDEQQNETPWVEWYERARKMTLDELPAFIDEMAASGRDYNTAAEATGAAAVATAWAMGNRMGLTGFQGGWVMWQFMKHWNGVGKRAPARLLDYENLLYPQYADTFEAIPRDVWEWAQDEARKKIAEQDEKQHPMSDRVYAHWKSVAAGRVPFGLKVVER